MNDLRFAVRQLLKAPAALVSALLRKFQAMDPTLPTARH
jgi:hypothetical protein